MSKDSLYKILRHVPGYFVGDPLRKADRILCLDLDLTAYALEKLRPGDAAFVGRSNGSFTYSVYHGLSKTNENELWFRVDDRGCFKTIQRNHFLIKVKVPALPRVLLENKALVSKYLEHKEKGGGVTENEIVSRVANDDQLSRPTAKPEFNMSDGALEKYLFNIVTSSSLININEVIKRKSESQQLVYQDPKQVEEKNCIRRP